MFIGGHVGFGLGALVGARRLLRRTTSLGRPALNLGWVAFFALLPDIIDKPVGLIWWELGSRRLFAHSLLFAVLVLACVRLLWPRLILYAWLVPVHLALDSMWQSRYTLLFPFRGWRFDPDPMPPDGLTSYIQLIVWKLTHQPEMMVSELAGLTIIGLYLWSERRQTALLPRGGSPP